MIIKGPHEGQTGLWPLINLFPKGRRKEGPCLRRCIDQLVELDKEEEEEYKDWFADLLSQYGEQETTDPPIPEEMSQLV